MGPAELHTFSLIKNLHRLVRSFGAIGQMQLSNYGCGEGVP